MPAEPHSRTTMASSSRPTGWRILGFGKHPEIAAAVQAKRSRIILVRGPEDAVPATERVLGKSAVGA